MIVSLLGPRHGEDLWLWPSWPRQPMVVHFHNHGRRALFCFVLFFWIGIIVFLQLFYYLFDEKLNKDHLDL